MVSYTSGYISQGFAVVRAQVPSVNPLTRTRTVRFSRVTGGLGDGLALNQSVSIFLLSGPVRDVVTVHKDAVLNGGGSRVGLCRHRRRGPSAYGQTGRGLGRALHRVVRP